MAELSSDSLQRMKMSSQPNNDNVMAKSIEMRLKFSSQSTRFNMANKTSTNNEIGPGKYEEIRSAFPLDSDLLIKKKMLASEYKKRMAKKTSKQETKDIDFPSDNKEPVNPFEKESQYFFKLKVSRKKPYLGTPISPAPGRYEMKSSTEEILGRKKIGKKGQFFSTSLKSKPLKPDVHCNIGTPWAWKIRAYELV